MGLLTIPEVIEIGDISNYLAGNDIADGAVIDGTRLSEDTNKSIAMVTDALRWCYESFPSITEVRATGRITITEIGDEGDNIEAFVNDPLLGVISLGSYTITNLDVTQASIYNTTDRIAQALAANTYGYQVVLMGTTSPYILIIAREGVGATINGNNNLYVVITETPIGFINTENLFRILTQNNNSLITEQLI